MCSWAIQGRYGNIKNDLSFVRSEMSLVDWLQRQQLDCLLHQVDFLEVARRLLQRTNLDFDWDLHFRCLLKQSLKYYKQNCSVCMTQSDKWEVTFSSEF